MIKMGKETILKPLYKNTFRIQSEENIFSEKAKVSIYQLENCNLSIQVEDEEKPFVYFTISFTKDDFESLKKKYRLYKNLQFSDFPDRMIELFRQVQEPQSDLYMFLESTERGSFSLLVKQKSAVLDVVHLDISVTSASSEELRTRAETMIDELRNQLTDMERKYRSAVKESQSHIKTIDEAMKTNSELERRLEDVRRDGENKLAEHELRFQSEKLRLSQEHKVDIADVHLRHREELSALSEKRNAAEKKLVQLQEKLDSTNEKLRESEAKIDAAVAESCRLNTQCATLKKRIFEMDRDLKESDAVRERLLQDFNDKSKALQTAHQERDELKARLNKIFQENIALNETIHRYQVEQRNSQFQLNSLRSKNNELDKALAKAHEIIPGLHKRLEAVELERKEAWARCELDRKQLTSLEEQNKRLSASLKKLKESETKCNEEINRKTEQIKNLTEEKASLKTTISGLYKELLQKQDRIKDTIKPGQDLDSYMYLKFMKDQKVPQPALSQQSRGEPLLNSVLPASSSAPAPQQHSDKSPQHKQSDVTGPVVSNTHTLSKESNKENLQLGSKTNPKKETALTVNANKERTTRINNTKPTRTESRRHLERNSLKTATVAKS